eukprot:m.211496 g.211496  ORF g.211496 m.211496 type:complete len:312 (+) comp22132_c0_seq2:1650-2585(+)
MLKLSRSVLLASSASRAGWRSMSTVLPHSEPHPTSTGWIKPTAPPTEIRHEQELRALAARLKLTFRDLTVLSQAMTHRGFDRKTNNARLSILGASLVDSTVAEYLYLQYPNLPPQAMRDIVEHLKSSEAAAQTATALGLAPAIDSHRKINPAEPQLHSVLAGAYHALVAAIHLDQGGKASRDFVRETTRRFFHDLDLNKFVCLEHPKLVLRDVLQKQGKPAAVCRLLKESGRTTHMPLFLVGVFSGDEKLAEGASWSIKRAEREAVRNALITHYGKRLSRRLPSESDNYTPEDEIVFMAPQTSASTASDEQ